jgi:hypothetical protein
LMRDSRLEECRDGTQQGSQDQDGDGRLLHGRSVMVVDSVICF